MGHQVTAWDFMDAASFSPKLASDCNSMWDDPLISFPTPPESTHGSPSANLEVDVFTNDESTASLSTMFYPGAPHYQVPPDLALLTSDSVYFYVHFSRLSEASSNYFGNLLPLTPERFPTVKCPIVNVPITSPVLNLVLYALYELSWTQYGPDFETLRETIDTLPKFGLLPQRFVAPLTPLYTLILSHAPLRPMDVYSLAGKFDLNELAVASSSHMLSFPLSTITDEVAQHVGPVYLKRLFFLHLGRMDALKRVLLQTPHPHVPTPDCDFAKQKRLTRAWSLASAYLAFDGRPDISTHAMESVFRPLSDHIQCELCLKSLNDRVQSLVVSWALIKRTI